VDPLRPRRRNGRIAGRPALAEEILALTKMNWNNTQFDNSMPITVRAARQVGAILKYLDRTSTTPTSYAYYM
jgi:hypothetical protein